MSHESTIDRLSAYLDGELTAEELVEVEGEVAVGHELDGRDSVFHEQLLDLSEAEFGAFGRGAVVVGLAG